MITGVRIAYPAPQGLMVIKESLNAKVRQIEYDANFPGFVLHLFDATDGGMQKKYLNLSSCVWFEYDSVDNDTKED